MKKRVISIATLVILMVSFTACGKYTPPESGTGKPLDPEPTQPGTTTGETYEVSLTLDGQKYVPPSTTKAQWSNGLSIVQSEFVNGVAKADNLSGEYSVTILDLPDSYIYNPNKYVATNGQSTTVIELYPIGELVGAGDGTGVYKPYELAGEGKYRATFTYDAQEIFYMFSPKEEGIYSIESWVDVTANDINPIVDIYNGTVGARYFSETKDGGSAYSSDYTKNFRYEISVSEAANTVGNSFAFAVRFDKRTEISYPVSVEFAVKYEGEPKPEDPSTSATVTVIPKEDFEQRKLDLANAGLTDPTQGGKLSWRYSYADTNNTLIDSNFKLDPEDGLYHRWDNITQTYGEILYARITTDCTALQTESGNGFMDGYVQAALSNVGGKRYVTFISDYYAKYCYNGGIYPVTAELKQFLEDYAKAAWLFMDGEGIAETWYNLRAGDTDMWLFACGYYA